MESADIKKLRKQIREMRASSNTGTPVAKMTAEQLEQEINYHTTAKKAVMNKAKRTKAVEPEIKTPEIKTVKKKLVKREVLVIPDPKKRPIRKIKVESEGEMSDLEIHSLDEVKPKIVSKKRTPVNKIQELPELKKNVKKAEPKEKIVRRLTNTKNMLKRPYTERLTRLLTADDQESQE